MAAPWQSLRLDLPVTPVHGIAVKNDDLVIATHGRSFYILDNISVLRQVTGSMTTEPVVLFDPADAVRSVSRGVIVDYFLKEPADKVTIEFLDPEGKSDPHVHRRSGARQRRRPAPPGDGRGKRRRGSRPPSRA